MLGAASGTFERLREQNPGKPRFEFIDGPITANNPMGVHHAWGRTLKDVFQRYKAQRGFDHAIRTASTARASGSRSRSRRRSASTPSARSRSLASPSSRAAAATACRVRERIDRAVEAPRDVDGLGRAYFTFSRHEHRVHLALPEGVPAPRLALQGPPLDRSGARAAAPRFRSTSCPATRIQGARAPVALRALPAEGPGGRGARRLDDHALDAPGQRRGRGQAGRRVRAQRPGGEWRARELAGDAEVVRSAARRGPGRARVRRARSTSCPRRTASSTG